MKKLLIIFSLALFLTLAYNSGGFGEELRKESKTVAFSGGTRQVYLIYADLNSPKIKLQVIAAKNQVGKTAPLKEIAESVRIKNVEEVAAINGTYFAAYTDMQPAGTMESDGKYMHLSNYGSTIGFADDGTAKVENLYTAIEGKINGKDDNDHFWMAWGINHLYNDPKEIVIFTPDYGDNTPESNYTAVVVKNGTVIDKHKGKAIIPKDGYTIVLGETHLVNRFNIGDQVEYRFNFTKLDYSTGHGEPGGPVEWKNIKTSINAGPMLVKNGDIVYDLATEGFGNDPKMLNPAQRSFIGVTKDNKLVIGTVSNVTVKQLGEIAKNLGLINSISLDGGGSSSLYYNGSYITGPGRDLSNAFVITKVKDEKINSLNSDEPSDWAKAEISKARSYKIITEKTMRNYRFNITREEFCEIAVKLYEALGGKKVQTTGRNPFTDTNNEEIIKAYSLKIVEGKNKNQFSPYEPITRQEMAVMIYRTLLAAKNDIDHSNKNLHFADEKYIETWAKPAVQFVVSNGIMQGTESNVLSPLQNTTREQAVVLVKRAYEIYIQ